MEHNPGFNRSHWMRSHFVAAAAAMVDGFGRKHKKPTITIFSYLIYGIPKPKAVRIS